MQALQATKQEDDCDGPLPPLMHLETPKDRYWQYQDSDISDDI